MIDSGAFLCQVTAVRNSAFSKSGFATQLSSLAFLSSVFDNAEKVCMGKSGRETSTRSQLLSFSARSRLVLGPFLLVATPRESRFQG